VQVGYRKAGWYNFDFINRLASEDYFYEGGASARRIIPGLQALASGDTVHLVPALGLTAVKVETESLLLLVADPASQGGDNVAWTFALTPTGPENCRLATRFRMRLSGGFAAGIAAAIVNDLGGATIQQPAMLAGLKRRAEAAYRKSDRPLRH
jgi:hypothetical protein